LIRNVNENKPEFGGMLFIFTPPMSSEVHAFSGGLRAVGRGASEGAAVDDGWFAATLFGEDSEVPAVLEDPADIGIVPFNEDDDSTSFEMTDSGFGRLGFVIGIADLATVLEAMALARAL
jgi:hypothetical protein